MKRDFALLSLSVLALLGVTLVFPAAAQTITNAALPVPLDILSLPLVAPVIDEDQSGIGTKGEAFSLQVYATNSPTGFSATGLPSGLSIDAGGLISGTPTEFEEFWAEVIASNAAGASEAVDVQLDILPPVPVIAPNQSASGTVGVRFGGFDFNYTNEDDSDRPSVVATGLPPGLEIYRDFIHGVPTEAGLFDVIVEISNSGGSSAPTVVKISIAPSPPAPAPPAPAPPAPAPLPAPAPQAIDLREAQIEALQGRILDVRRRVKNPTARAAQTRRLNLQLQRLRLQQAQQ